MSYYRNNPPNRFRGPRGWVWVWIALAAASLLLAMYGTGFRLNISYWVMAFINNFCNALIVVVLISAVMSWFPLNPYARFPALMRDVVSPLLDPLRRVIPLVGSFDFSALAAVLILSLIPMAISAIVRLF